MSLNLAVQTYSDDPECSVSLNGTCSGV